MSKMLMRAEAQKETTGEWQKELAGVREELKKIEKISVLEKSMLLMQEQLTTLLERTGASRNQNLGLSTDFWSTIPENGESAIGWANFRPPKLELPIFLGEGVEHWVFRAERYFAINQLSEEEKIEAAAVCFEGPALSWFQWEHKSRSFQTWPELKLLITDRFRELKESSCCDRLLMMKQEGSISEYRSKFEILASNLTGIPEEVMISAFFKGLKNEIKGDVQLMRPSGLRELMQFSQIVEDKNSMARSSIREGFRGPMRLTQENNNSSFRVTTEGLAKQPGPPKAEIPRRRLIKAEMQMRREKGLCYRCDNKFTIGHRCKNRMLQVLIMEDEEAEDVDIEKNEITGKLETRTTPNTIELSFNSIMGVPTPRTVKMKGKIKNKEIIILIDSGATHNFIVNKIVRELQLEIQGIAHYEIALGNGRTLEGFGVCKNIRLELADLKIIEEFLPIELGNTYVILGMLWLESVGNMHVDWKNKIMRWKVDQKVIELWGTQVWNGGTYH